MEKIPQPQREVIELPENREPLQRKLQEYQSRFDVYAAPETQLDTVYKMAVLTPLVEHGVVNRTEVKKRLKNEYGSVNESLFYTAWAVISDYVQTGGQKLHGGTGLPRPQEDMDL